ncbi:ATP-binding protein [Planctomicrobium sp. SH664]|uniref:ATP-binding protein n=1 Tax=Planctomicrobium sp. SH664 TaxID=3448125 RepID=UPI003F5B5F2A
MLEATLLVIQGPDQGRRHELAADAIYVGRGAQNEIRVLDTEVSRRHIKIFPEGDSWHFVDLRSANGTYLNGQPALEARLQPGDQIQIGRTILLFTLDREPAESSAVEQISLVARSSADDQSRIVGKAPPIESESFASWAQAGANLQLLYQITEEAVRPSTSLDELLRRILDLTLRAVGADRGCMLVTDSKTDRIEPRVVCHVPGINVNERMPISTSIVEYVIQKGQGVRTSDAQHDSRFDAGQSIVKSGIREAMCVPMQGRYELMGVIYVDTTSTARPAVLTSNAHSQFNDQLLRLLLAIGRQSALAIENQRYQESLVTAERLAAVGQTVAILNHHIKNILQGIKGGGYLIDMGLRDKNEDLIRKGWGVVDRNQSRIYDLVMDMLTFSKERRPQLRKADLRKLLDEILELMQSRAEATGAQLQLREVSPVPAAYFDPEGMHRAILNLVANAIDAVEGRESPRVEVRYGFHPELDHLWVEVEDNGLGIEEAAIPRLFQLFESSKGSKGTGLGLAVSQKILTEHGGTISVASQIEVGTCFHMEWPNQGSDGENSESM